MTDMDYKELIENLERRGMKNGSSLGEHSGLYEQAAYAITDLLARAEAAEARAKKAEREIERLKRIMRSEGIVVIPSKYTGCKSEWNLPRKGKKEE